MVHCMDPDSGIPVTYQAASVILAGGMFSRPKTLGLPKELDLPVVTHRQPKSWDRMGSDPPTVLVVGAGLSASDCIVQAMHHRWKVRALRAGSSGRGLRMGALTTVRSG